MAKKRFPEFPTDWHQDSYLVCLERELAGYLNRVLELKALGVDPAEKSLVEAQSGAEAARAELRRLGHGQEPAAKRPRVAAESRAKPAAEKKPKSESRAKAGAKK